MNFFRPARCYENKKKPSPFSEQQPTLQNHQENSESKQILVSIINFLKTSILDHYNLWTAFFHKERQITNKVIERKINTLQNPEAHHIALPAEFKKFEQYDMMKRDYTMSSIRSNISMTNSTKSGKKGAEKDVGEALPRISYENLELLEQVEPKNWLKMTEKVNEEDQENAENQPSESQEKELEIEAGYLTDRHEDLINLASFNLKLDLSEVKEKLLANVVDKDSYEGGSKDFGVDGFYNSLVSKVEKKRRELNFEVEN